MEDYMAHKMAHKMSVTGTSINGMDHLLLIIHSSIPLTKTMSFNL